MKWTQLALSLALAAATGHAAAPADESQPKEVLLIHQFDSQTGLADWVIQDDVVMGGVSRGRIEINEAGDLLFAGDISLENDGGFSSVQRDFDSIDVSAGRAICLGVKGDGKRYQLRVESAPGDRHGYAFDFDTSGEWQTIEIPFDQMYAIRHGDRLDLPNYPGQTLAQIQILFGNGREESFQIEVDRIWLR
jgi:NADH dehydrogenase [ubiquinone] 1 alpha subcomplex assembly factor 1